MIELSDPELADQNEHARITTVTPELRGAMLDQSISVILRILREQLALDVVFVSEFVAGRRIYRHVDAAPERRVIEVGGSDRLEDSLCARIVDGRLPAFLHSIEAVRADMELPDAATGVGTFVGVPVRLASGKVFGTLCGFGFETNDALDEREVARLEMAAGVIARLLEEAEGAGAHKFD